MVLAELRLIFVNGRAFLFGPSGYEIFEKIRALACPLFKLSTPKVYVHGVGLCTVSIISQEYSDPT